ncbi:hypothetical protein D3C79_35190 [compost metagenome]
MKKIECVFLVDRILDLATTEVNPVNQWVLDGEGVASLKFDGTSCMVKDGVLYKRWNRTLKKPFDRQHARNKAGFCWELSMFRDAPEGAISCESEPAPISLHWPHWIPVTQGNGLENEKYHFAFAKQAVWEDGTYELVGPGIQDNVHRLAEPVLIKHGSDEVSTPDRSFEGLRALMESLNCEGVVWHHPDGRMAKLRRDHFGFEWGKPDVRNHR